MRNFRRNNKSYNRGAAMIFAILIIGVILVFTFALLLVSYTLYASQNKNIASLRCSEAANTLSVALEKELEDSNAYITSDLWKYLRCNTLQDVKTWPYYDADQSGHGQTEAFRYFDLKTNGNYPEVEGFPGSLKLCIYWTVQDNDDIRNKLRTGTEFLDLSTTERSDAEIHIEIIAETASQSYTVENTYKVTISELDIKDSESVAVGKMAKTSYGSSEPGQEKYIFNPQQLTCGADTDSTTYDIKTTEKWSLELISRE